MKKLKIIVNLPPDAADLYPELYYIGRGADPRGRDIEAWEREEKARLERVEARRLAKEAEAAAAVTAKPEAAE